MNPSNVEDSIATFIISAFRTGNLRALAVGTLSWLGNGKHLGHQEHIVVNAIRSRPSGELRSLVYLSLQLERHNLRDIMTFIHGLPRLKSFTFWRYDKLVHPLVEDVEQMWLPLSHLSLAISTLDIDKLFPPLSLPNLVHLALSVDLERDNDNAQSQAVFPSALKKLGPQLHSLSLTSASTRLRTFADITSKTHCPFLIPSILSTCTNLRSFVFDAEWNTSDGQVSNSTNMTNGNSDNLNAVQVLVSTPHPTLRHIRLEGTVLFKTRPCCCQWVFHGRCNASPTLSVDRNLDAITKYNFPCLESVSVHIYNKGSNMSKRCGMLDLRSYYACGGTGGHTPIRTSKADGLGASGLQSASSFIRLVDRCIENNIGFTDNVGNLLCLRAEDSDSENDFDEGGRLVME